MIKINLLRDSGAVDSNPVGGSGDIVGANPFSTGVDVKDLVLKVLLLILPAVGFYVWHDQTVTAKKTKLEALQVEVKKADAELASLDLQVKEVEKFLEEKRKLDSQLDTIKKLSKERLRNVKSMDALQTIIPTKAWLTSLSIKEMNVELEGQAVDDIVISDFMRDLEESVFFANVSIQTSEELKKEVGSVKRFIIKANLENL